MFRFRFPRLLTLAAVCVVVLGIGIWLVPAWRYTGELHAALRQADRLIVRDNEYNGPETVDAQPVLFEVTSSAELKQILGQLEFQTNQFRSGCKCHGFPMLDWQKDGKRIAVTSVQHGKAIRWDGFEGDATLTEQSSRWLVSWLTSHGVPAERLR